MISIKKTEGGKSYGFPFLGPMDHPLSVKVALNGLTTDEVDTLGYLKPGVPFTREGKLVAAQGNSTPSAAVAATGNTGNGTVSGLAGKAGKPSEVITLKAKSATVFSVRGSRSGVLGDATVNTPYVSAAINLLITAGGTAFVAGDEFTIVIAAATSNAVHGVTIAPIKVVEPNPTNASLAASTVSLPVVVGVIGVVVRDVIEDNLARALTDAEVAAFEAPGCRVVLSRT